MNFRSKLIAVTGSALILASSITMGAAADPSDSGNAMVTIDPAENAAITVSISETNDFGDHFYSLANQLVTGSLTVTVDDMRGTAEGWNVNLKATDFEVQEESAENATDIPIGKLSLTAGAPAVADSVAQPAANTNGQTTKNLTPVTTSDQQLWTAADEHGAGTFNLGLTGNLTIPGGTLIGEYQSQVTVTLGAAPTVDDGSDGEG